MKSGRCLCFRDGLVDSSNLIEKYYLSMNHLSRIFPFLVSFVLLGLILYVSEFAAVWDQFTEISFEIIFFVFTLLLFNLFVVSFRLWRVLNRFGNHVQLSTAFKASICGHLGGVFIWSLLGQTLGRQTILYRVGIKSSVVAMVTACERILLIFISLTLAVMGTVYLIDNRIIINLFPGLPIIEIALVIIIAKFLYFYYGRTFFENSMIELIKLRQVGSFIFEISSITIFAQLFMLMAFATAIGMLNPDIPIIEVFSVAAIISFVSSIPISINGWGVREAAAVIFLKYIDIPTEQALAISILIGLCSTAVILVASPYIFKRDKKLDNHQELLTDTEEVTKKLEKPAIWLLAISVASLVLFQVHLRIPQINTLININLADPFALFAFTIVLQEIIQRKMLPKWRFSGFNMSLIILSVILIFGFINALPEIGVTSWALGSRLSGWIIILGYLSTGYLVSSYLGLQGVRRFTENVLLIAIVIILVQVLIRMLDYYGFDMGIYFPRNFEGYASNRSAFAFQLLICLSFAIAYMGPYQRVISFTNKNHMVNKRRILLVAIILAGLLLTGSRAGIGTGLIILLSFLMATKIDRGMLMKSSLLGYIFYLGIIYLPPLSKGFNIFAIKKITLLKVEPIWTFKIASDSERWETITRGLDMWLENPLLGGGLGAFIESSKSWANEPLVIHNTPVWILAEFGLLGALIFGGVFIAMLFFTWRWKSESPSRRMLLSILIIFAIFSMAHEIYYQRMFWLVLGLVMAKPMGAFDNLKKHKIEQRRSYCKLSMKNNIDHAG